MFLCWKYKYQQRDPPKELPAAHSTLIDVFFARILLQTSITCSETSIMPPNVSRFSFISLLFFFEREPKFFGLMLLEWFLRNRRMFQNEGSDVRNCGTFLLWTATFFRELLLKGVCKYPPLLFLWLHWIFFMFSFFSLKY